MKGTLDMIRTPAWRRYNWRVAWLSLVYVGLLLGAVYGFKHELVPGALRYLVAVLPALPVVGIFIAIGRYLLEEQDEYVRMLMVRQTLWENFDVVGHIDAYYVAILWFAGLGIGGLINKLTLGDGGC